MADDQVGAGTIVDAHGAPPPIVTPSPWNALIRRTIDQCFAVQEQIKDEIHRLEGDPRS